MSTNQNPMVPIPPQAYPGWVPGYVYAPAYTLFDANSVALATFFGTPVMGCALIALNDRRLGRGVSSLLPLVAGILVTALAGIVGWHLSQTAELPISLALIFGTRWAAERLQGASVAEHVQRGGRLASKWLAFWMSIAFLAVLVGVIFGVVYSQSQQKGVMIGTKDEVFYSGSATSQDALALGNALKSIGYFTDKGANVFVVKGANGTIVSFVVADGTWNDATMVSNFELIMRQEAATVGGLPITLRLVNTSLTVEKEELLQ